MRGLDFLEAIPPKSVCCDALSMMEGVSHYTGLIFILTQYYGIPKMILGIDPKKARGAIARYYAAENAAYTKNKTTDYATVLHEFFHHLVAHGVVTLNGQREEELATEYARIILQRGR